MALISWPDCGKGVNKDLMPAELEDGVWSDCLNFRFRNGFAEKFEGAVTAVSTTGTAYPEWLHSYGTPTTRYVIEAGNAKVYAYNGTTQNEITRYTDGVAIASITRVGTTATLTTATAHGRTTGQTVTVYLASPSQYNGTYVITVTGATTFTYVMASDPGASASPVGAYSYNVTSDYTGSFSDVLTGGSLNGVLIFNNPVNGLYYWNGDTATRLRRLPLVSNISDVSRPFKNYIVRLASTVDGVKKPHNVAWSDAAEPGSIPTTFTASATNDAGDVDLSETAGAAIDCVPLGDVNIVYKKDARYAMQYIGGNDVFRFSRLPGDEGLFARNCVVDTPKGHVFLTQNRDVMLHQGGAATSIANGRIRQWIATNLLTTSRIFVCKNPEKDEVWVAFATDTAYCNKVAVWNWNDDTWGILDFGVFPLSCGASGLWPTSITTSDRLLVAQDLNVKLVDSTNASSQTDAAYLERVGLHFGDRSAVKNLQRSRWVLDWGTSGPPSVTISHGSRQTADVELANTVSYTAASTYAAASADFADARAIGGKYCAIKLEADAAVAHFSVRSVDMDVTKGGNR